MHIDIIWIDIATKVMKPLRKICITFDHEQQYGFMINKTVCVCSELDNNGFSDVSLVFRNTCSPKKESTIRKGNGLCQNCALLATCGWYRDDAVIFHCEHYL